LRARRLGVGALGDAAGEPGQPARLHRGAHVSDLRRFRANPI
jgi:hypothetical protein